MKASFGKRLAAFIIDSIIVTMVFTLLTNFIPQSKNVENLNKEMSEISEKYLNEEITDLEYYNQYGILSHSLDKEMFLSSLLNFVLLIGAFVIVPYYNKGQTLGKKILKIKLVKDDGELGINDLIMRNVITNGFGYTLIGLAIMFLVNDNVYFITISILSFIQFLLVITSVFMVLYRHDKKGLQDIICKTSVIEENIEVK